MIFYYTATGNCLYVARQIEDNLISIPTALKEDRLEYEDDTIGIVAPIYAGELPQTVREFIQRVTLKANYIYILLTYGKNDSVASKWSNDFLIENGIKANYIKTILMVDNYLPGFDMLEEMAMNKKEDEQIQNIIKDIKARKNMIQKPTVAGIALYKVASARFKEHPELINGESLYVTDQCKGCGICEQVCPTNNIDIIDGKAVRKNQTCDFCLACIHHCPYNGLALRHGDKNPEARYRHKEISLQDIIRSNKGE